METPVGSIPQLVAQGLTVAFSGKTVLHGIDLEVSPGQLTVLIGPSGSGKTTLLRAFNRLNEYFPGCSTTGRVCLRWPDRSVDLYGGEWPLTRIRRSVAMVFQAPNVLPKSIEDNLRLPLQMLLGIKGEEATERIRKALEDVDLWEEVADRLDDPAATLSGGQKQRLCLARALVLDPLALLLDEPTSSLDFRAALRIEDLLLRLRERYTILAVSHSLEQTLRIADRIMVLRRGKILRVLEREEVSALADLEDLKNLVAHLFA